MKIGLIKGVNPTPASKINANALLKGIGIGLGAAVAVAAATAAAIKKANPKEDRNA